jgi:SAM-dependent methyltransferase
LNHQPAEHRICDYEETDYRAEFWEGRGREYEDRVERIAIQRLLPPHGERLLEAGAGFGRLTDLYAGFGQVVLVDYSRSQLEQARERFGLGGRHVYVAADVYHLPFAPGLFDAATLVRTLHHLERPVEALGQVRQAMCLGGVFVLEYANKRNLKAIGRWLLGKQVWNPFARQPIEFAELHFDFHPAYVQDALRQAGFRPGRRLTVSHYRLDLLKRNLPTRLLVWLDSIAQLTGDMWQLSPSVFVRAEAVGDDLRPPQGVMFRCPACGCLTLLDRGEMLMCADCGRKWAIRDGIFDFREPLK